MAEVLLLTLVFPPDAVSTAHVLGDLAMDLVKRGHKVTVLTTTPHYNRDPIAESVQPLKKYWGRLLFQSDYNGIPVYHTAMPRKGKNALLRVLSWANFHVLSTIAGLTVIPKPDIIIVPSPPLTIGLSAYLLGRVRHLPYIYNVQEIYPDIAIHLGLLKNRLLIQSLFKLERFIYDHATAITVISPMMQKKLLAKRVSQDKIRLIPNFVDVHFFRPLQKDNAFSRQHNIHNKFVITYAGNMGPAQGLTHFIQAAALLRDEPKVHFMMMGDGILRETFQQQVAQLCLPHFTFLPYQPYSLMPEIYAASDLSFVSLAADIGDTAIPSKIYRILACARPVLVASGESSDLSTLVKQVGCGVVVRPGSAQALADEIRNLITNRVLLEQMGKQGWEHVVENYTRDVIADRYDQLIRESIAKG
ncbi:MAG: glycosyltransferase family 4 protein [Nitrospirota bacterium]